MVELGIDEITLVLQAPDVKKTLISINDWRDVAESIISRFERQADLETVFGKRSIEKKPPAGYTVGYRYGSHSFYFCVAYHDVSISMGTIIKFSATSLDYYLEATGLKIHEFLQKVKHSDYEQRLSRIDLTADYIDEGIDISAIYQDLMDSKVAIFREQYNSRLGKMEYRRITMKYEGILVKDVVQSLYVGSVKSNSRLRVYDKRIEQIVNKGNKLDKALQCKNWIRFEGVFRNEYAHQLSSALMKIKSDGELGNLIALTLYQKYLFMYTDNGVAIAPTKYTQMLIDCVSNKNFKLRASLTRNYDLTRNITYLLDGSGIMNTLYKLQIIWGMDSVLWLLKYISEKLQDDFIPSDDCRYWLKHNLTDYQSNYPDFEKFLKENLSLLL